MLFSLFLATALIADSMAVELSAPDQVRAGDPVQVTIRVTNRGSAPHTLYLRGRPIAFDLIVTDARGKVVWRRLQGATISMVLQVRELKPGETLTLEDVWHQRTNAGAPVDPGEYRLKGQVLTDTDHPLESPISSLRIIR